MYSFSEEIAKLIQEIIGEFEQNNEQDIFDFAIKKIMDIKEVNENEARAILREILDGILIYREMADNPEKLKDSAQKIGPEGMKVIEEEVETLQNLIKLGGKEN